ncbi:MAG: TRAP transporter small permease subunit [Hyphomicrobium sp.]
MAALMALSRGIDRFTTMLGRLVAWLIVAAIAVSAGNAIVRKMFDQSSNAWLEMQWLMFGTVFLLAAPWTLKSNEHIRIDVLSSRLPQRVRDVIDVVGHALFLLPVAGVVLVTSWPFFLRAYAQNEQSSNAGGLPQWPAKFLIPLAFALLLIQGISELIKRVAIMRGDLSPTEPGGGHGAPSATVASPTSASRPTVQERG